MTTITRLKNRFWILLSSGFLSLSVGAQEDIGAKLSPDVRALLTQEMVAILGATQTITDAMIRGDDQTVAEQAQRIHDSFILAQELTKEQHEALIKAASKEFLNKDGEFHVVAASLAQAARTGDKPRQQKIFSQMLEACVSCHTAHAAQRFPSFHATIKSSPTPQPPAHLKP
jgi:hypothetical protein